MLSAMHLLSSRNVDLSRVLIDSGIKIKRMVTKIPTTTLESKSNRMDFKSIPVHPSILSHIQKIGIGRTRKKMNEILTTKSVAPPPFSETGMIHERSRSKYTVTGNQVKIVGTATSSKCQPSTNGVYDEDREGKLNNKRSEEIIKDFNRDEIPEIAFAGRSNVGKSTLLNALLYSQKIPREIMLHRGKKMSRKSMKLIKLSKGLKATMSEKPGETREITLYELSNKLSFLKKTITASLIFADLPGFGFAFASEDQSKKYRNLIKTYLLKRGKRLKRILLLVDARHGFKATDITFLSDLEHDLKKTNKKDLTPIQIVLTKCDLVQQVDLARRVSQVRHKLSEILLREPSKLPIMLVSAKAGLNFRFPKEMATSGILELQRELASLVSFKL